MAKVSDSQAQTSSAIPPDAASDATGSAPIDGLPPIDVAALVGRAMSAASTLSEWEEQGLAEIAASVRVLYHGLRRGPGRLPKRLADVITINHALAALAYTYGGGVADGDDEP